MGEYLELQGVVKDGAIIHNVEEKNNRVYFMIGMYKFQTFGDQVYHEKNPTFNHPFSDIMAARKNDPEEIIKEEKRAEEIEEFMDLWDKHKVAMYKLIFLRAFNLLKNKGEEEFIKYINYHFDIIPNGDNCNNLIKLLENDSK